MKKTFKISSRVVSLAASLCLSLSLFCGCQKEGEDIVKTYSTASEVSQICGIDEVTFVPEGYKACAFRTVYDVVSETEYQPVAESGDSENKIFVVLRVTGANNTGIKNLSGFENTSLKDNYYPIPGKDFIVSIEGRDEFLAAEWTYTYGEKQCKFALSMTNGDIDSFKKIIDEAFVYIGASSNDETLADIAPEQKTDGVMSYESPAEVAMLLGIKKMTYSPQSFNASGYRIVKDVISETEYVNADGNTLIVRVTDGENDIPLISEMSENAAIHSYLVLQKTGEEVAILAENDLFAVEFESLYGEKKCRFALVFDGKAYEFPELIDSFVFYILGHE